MPKMPAMEAVVKILENEGVEYVFGVPGGAINPFYLALSKSKKIKAQTYRHEEGCAHAADGYARASGKVGICACIGGPAGADTVVAVRAAYMEGSPTIFINGDIPLTLRGEEGTTSVNIVELMKPIAKKTYFVTKATQIPMVFREAFKIAQEGRPGPVVIEIPVDVQRKEIVYEPDLDAPLEVNVPKPNMKKIERAVDMLLEAENPIITMGGGCIRSNSCEDLVALAEYLAIPVIPTIMAKGGIPYEHPLHAGQVGTRLSIPPGNETFLESDVVLAVGCRFGDRHTGAKDVFIGDRKFIHIDIEPTQIGRIIPVDLGIVSDAKLAIQALLKVAKAKTGKKELTARVKALSKLRKDKARKDDFDDIPIKPQRVFKEMNDVLPDDTCYTTTIGLVQMFSGQFQKLSKPNTYFIDAGFGALGWDVPAAMGVKVARPESMVVALAGDFGFGYMENQLAAASMYGIAITVAIIDDGYLGLIRQSQELAYGFNYGVAIAYDRLAPRLTDFVKLAEAYGIAAERVENPKDIAPALERAMKANAEGRPYLIDFITESVDCSTGGRIDKVTERGFRAKPIPPAKVDLEVPSESKYPHR